MFTGRRLDLAKVGLVGTFSVGAIADDGAKASVRDRTQGGCGNLLRYRQVGRQFLDVHQLLLLLLLTTWTGSDCVEGNFEIRHSVIFRIGHMSGAHVDLH